MSDRNSMHPRGSPDDERDLIQAGYRFALSVTRHPEEAEDIVQQSCFRVIAKKGGLHSRPYLFQTIRNLFYDLQRRKKLIPFERIDDIDPPAIQSDPSLRIDLETQLSQLSSEEREVLYLNCVEGYTAAELAELLERPRSTILNILSRAKARLTESRDKTNRKTGG